MDRENEQSVNISLSLITCNLIIGDECQVKTKYFRNPNPIRVKSLSNTICKSVNFSILFSFPSLLRILSIFNCYCNFELTKRNIKYIIFLILL